jgi:hypothetical protein
MFALTAGGYMYLDFKMSSRWAGREDAEGLTVGEYLSGLTGRLAGLTGAATSSGLPTKLVDMLPKPPAGWTVRAVDAKDIDGFLPKNAKKADKDALAAVKAMVNTEDGKGTEVAALTYEKGDRKVIIRAVRYPNIIFTSFMAMQQRMELQMKSAQFRGIEFMTVRGLDVTEDILPEGFRGRYFIADVGAQIHLRVLAPKRTADADLVPFFETLHVKAMNAGVIDKVEGLGDVPVIVLASALDKAERDAYLADLSAREADRDKKEADARAAAEAAEAPAEGSGGGFLGTLFGAEEAPVKATEAPAKPKPKPTCSTDKDGVKRCVVDSGGD